jgi:hypothetical protein
MLNAAWLIVHLMGSAAPMPAEHRRQDRRA